MPHIRTDFKILVVLTFAGIASSIFAFKVPIEGDEAASFLVDWSYPFSNLFFSYSDITNHKLFTALSRMSMGFFGDHEWAFHFPVFIAGVISIPLIYILTHLIVQNRQIAFVSSLLLLFSYPRFYYSINGRGYIFTLFFAIVLLIALIKLLEPKVKFYWKALWIVGGLCFIFAIPSNLGFLFGLGVYFLFAVIYEKPSKHNFIKQTWALWTLFIILAIYYWAIYGDLQRGVISYTNYANQFLRLNDLKISFSKLEQTLDYLSQPWGGFFYLFVVLGIFFLKRDTPWSSLFTCLFVFPIFFIFASNVMGPPRTFVFWIPPFMILASLGICKSVQSFSPKPQTALTFFICLILGVISIYESKTYLDQRLNSSVSRINESKEVLSYITSETSPHDLILFPFYDRVLRHYIEDPSSKKMLNILRDKKLKRILIVGKKGIEPNQILSIAGYNKKHWWAFPWTKKYFDVEKDIGSFRVHSLNLKIDNLNSHNNSTTDESIDLKTNSLFSVGFSEDFKFIGNKSLVLKRKQKKEILAISNEGKNIKVKTQDNFLLYIYGKKYLQKSRSMLSRTQGAVPFWLKGSNSVAKFFQIAPLYGIYSLQKGKPEIRITHPHWNYLHPTKEIKHYWKIEFRLSSIEPGNYKIKEIFELKDDEAFFDGMQTFLIHK